MIKRLGRSVLILHWATTERVKGPPGRDSGIVDSIGICHCRQT